MGKMDTTLRIVVAVIVAVTAIALFFMSLAYDKNKRERYLSTIMKGHAILGIIISVALILFPNP